MFVDPEGFYKPQATNLYHIVNAFREICLVNANVRGRRINCSVFLRLDMFCEYTIRKEHNRQLL